MIFILLENIKYFPCYILLHYSLPLCSVSSWLMYMFIVLVFTYMIYSSTNLLRIIDRTLKENSFCIVFIFQM